MNDIPAPYRRNDTEFSNPDGLEPLLDDATAPIEDIITELFAPLHRPISLPCSRDDCRHLAGTAFDCIEQLSRLSITHVVALNISVECDRVREALARLASDVPDQPHLHTRPERTNSYGKFCAQLISDAFDALEHQLSPIFINSVDARIYAIDHERSLSYHPRNGHGTIETMSNSHLRGCLSRLRAFARDGIIDERPVLPPNTGMQRGIA